MSMRWMEKSAGLGSVRRESSLGPLGFEEAPPADGSLNLYAQAGAKQRTQEGLQGATPFAKIKFLAWLSFPRAIPPKNPATETTSLQDELYRFSRQSPYLGERG